MKKRIGVDGMHVKAGSPLGNERVLHAVKPKLASSGASHATAAGVRSGAAHGIRIRSKKGL